MDDETAKLRAENRHIPVFSHLFDVVDKNAEGRIREEAREEAEGRPQQTSGSPQAANSPPPVNPRPIVHSYGDRVAYGALVGEMKRKNQEPEGATQPQGDAARQFTT